MKLSLCMIVKDEESLLDRCLSSAADFADEIIIADTGSRDRTKEIARKYTDRVYDFKWEDDFSAARNFSVSKASGDYFMWLDADDVVDSANAEKIRALKRSLDPEINIVLMKYNVAFDSENRPVFSFYRERIVKNDGTNFFLGEIHEAMPLKGRLLYSDIEINHKKEKVNEPGRNLRIFRKMLAKGKSLSPRERYYYGRELYYNNFYSDALIEFNGFLAQNEGLDSDKIQACLLAGKCCLKLSYEEKALEMFFKSFSYGVPKAEVCCNIADLFLEREKLEQAVFWYSSALSCPQNPGDGFFQQDYYGFVPLIQLCLCYDRMGKPEKAMEYNEKAGKIKPYNQSYKYNKEYFEKRRQKQ